MAIIGIQLDRKNPLFTSSDFVIWMPQYKQYIDTDEGKATYESVFEITNNKIFASIFGADWKLAMSYAIAHYITLIAKQSQAPSGSTLAEIAGGSTTGVLTSMSVGGFSKAYDIDKTMSTDSEAMFWNQTSYGSALYSLLKTKALPTIMVVTSNPIPGAN